jgi:lysophospholipase L1-like esterase
VSGDNPSNISVKENAVNGSTPSADNISNGTVFATTAVCIGDSITNDTGASVAANGWTNLYCTALGMTRVNKGINGTILQDSTYQASAPGVAQVGNGYDRFLADIQGINACMRTVIAYGFNDARYTGGNGADGSGPTGVTLAAYTAQLKQMLTALITNGTRPLDIHVVSPYWMTDTGLGSGTTGYVMTTNLGSVSAARTQLQAFAQAAHDVALEYGTLFTDGYAALSGVGAGGIGADNIHPNDTGHAGIAAAAEPGGTLNSMPMPTNVAMSRNGAGGATVSWTAATPPIGGPTITGYTVEYGLKSAIAVGSRFIMTGTTTTAGTSQNFSGLADGWYICRVRTNFSDSSHSPWAWFIAGRNIDSRTTDTLTFSTDFSTATPGSNVEMVSGWTKAPISTSSLTIGGAAGSRGFASPDVMGGKTANQTCLYSGGAQGFPGSGKAYNEQTWIYRSSATGNENTSVMLMGNNASAANGVLALYNDTNFRVFTLNAGSLATATGTTTYTVALVPNLEYQVRLEVSSGAQTIYLNNVAVATASAATGGAWGTDAGFRMANTSFLNTDFTGTHIKSVRVGTTV